MIVMNNGKYIRVFTTATLVPGANDLSETQVADLRKESSENAVKQAILDADIDIPEMVVSFKDMKVDDIKTLLAETTDLELLAKFKGEEEGEKNRATVITEIEKRVSEITGE